MNKLSWLLVILFVIASETLAADLRTAAQESYPKYFLENDTVSGICIDIINAVEEVNPEARFIGKQSFLPFKRLQKYLSQGEIDVFFGIKKTTKREDLYTFLDFPLYEVNYVVAARVADDISVESSEDFMQFKEDEVLSVFGTAASRFAKAQGLNVYDAPLTPEKALEMLVKKRGRFVFYHDLGLKSLITKRGWEEEVKVLPISFKRYTHDVAFSKGVDSESIRQIKNALEDLEKSGELNSIRSHYGLNNR